MGRSDAVLHTLLYSDIFSFPLTEKELWVYLHSDTYIPKKDFVHTLRGMSRHLTILDGYYALQKRGRYIIARKRREKVVVKKIKKAEHIAQLLSMIPTICFIGISGSLAAGDVEERDDIDLFVIAENNAMWVTRLCVLILLELQGVRRKKRGQEAADAICVNMILEKQAMAFGTKRRDVYTAREIAQLIPLFERGNTYNEFLTANTWVNTFLPNAIRELKKREFLSKQRNVFFSSVLIFCNTLAKKIQYQRIIRTTTREEIRNSFLAFHPIDYRTEILKAFEKKRKQYYEKV